MFHRPSLLMTGLVLMMGLAWFGMQHFYGDGRSASAEMASDDGARARVRDN